MTCKYFFNCLKVLWNISLEASLRGLFQSDIQTNLQGLLQQALAQQNQQTFEQFDERG